MSKPCINVTKTLRRRYQTIPAEGRPLRSPVPRLSKASVRCHENSQAFSQRAQRARRHRIDRPLRPDVPCTSARSAGVRAPPSGVNTSMEQRSFDPLRFVFVPCERPKAGPAASATTRLRFAVRRVRLRPSHADLSMEQAPRSQGSLLAIVPSKAGRMPNVAILLGQPA